MADTQTVPNAMRVECEECGAVKVIFLPKLPASPVAVPAPAEERLSVLEEIARDEAIIERAVRVGEISWCLPICKTWHFETPQNLNPRETRNCRSSR
jgi:hypothetical protein